MSLESDLMPEQAELKKSYVEVATDLIVMPCDHFKEKKIMTAEEFLSYYKKAGIPVRRENHET